MKKIFAVVCLMALAACTSSSNPPAPSPNPTPNPVCTAETDVANTFVPAFAAALNCTGVAAMTADITNAINFGNLCPVVAAQQSLKDHVKLGKFPVKGPIANLACPLVVDGVVAAAGTKLPSTWQCNPAVNTSPSSLVGIATGLCEKLPF